MDPLHLIEADAVKSGFFSFDFETESETGNPNDAKNQWLARPVILALASPNHSGAFEITPELTDTYRRLATNPKLFGVAHNAPYDVIVGHRAGMMLYDDWQARCIDTIGYAWAVDEERPKGLKILAQRYLNKRMVTYEEAAIDNPILREIDVLNTRLLMHRQNKELWAVADPRKVRRPYPTFDDPAMHWNSIKKQKLRELAIGAPDPALNEQLAEFRDQIFDELERWRHADYVDAFENNAATRLQELRRQAHQALKVYAADDAATLFPLLRKLLTQVRKEGADKWMEIEMDTRWQTIGMEISGMTVDRAELARRGEVIKPLVEEFRGRCYNLAKQEFNPKSPNQLCELLFSTMHLNPPTFKQVWVGRERVPIPKLTKGGIKWCLDQGYIVEDPADGRQRWANCIVDLRKPDQIPDQVRKEFISTDKITLSMLDHPIGQAILNFRSVAQLMSTYIESMGDKLDASHDGQIHGRFNSFGTDTGRFSSSGPNLQNIPSRKKPMEFDARILDLGPKLRETFTPPPPDSYAPEGYVLIVSDQSQIELRVIGHFTRDFNLCQVYSEQVTSHGLTFYTGDVHAKTSASLGIPRKPAKCFHLDTEVLTRGGWRKITDIDTSTEIMTANPQPGCTVTMAWDRPTEVFTEHRTELVHLENKHCNIKVTPDHRMVSWDQSSEQKPRVTTPEKFAGCRYFMNAGQAPGSALAERSWLQLAVAVEADGSFKGHKGVRLGFTRARKIKRLKELLETCGLEEGSDYQAVCRRINGKPGTFFTLEPHVRQRLRTWLNADRSFAWSLLDLAPELRGTLLDELYHWDSRTTLTRCTRSIHYNTVSETSRDVIQALGAITNRKVSFSVEQPREAHHRPQAVMTISDRPYSRGRSMTATVEKHDGLVACLSVPSSYVITRSGGFNACQRTTTLVVGQSVNFGFNYGMGPEKFARMVPLLDEHGQYDIPRATAWRDGFFQTYNGLPIYLDSLRECWDQGQHVFRMISGRHRHFNDDKVMPGKILNAKVQGSSADMIKANMYIIRKYVMPKFPGLRPIGQVHDELIYACPRRFAAEAAVLIKYVMEYDWFGLTVPILADTTICANSWAEEGDDRVPPVGTFFARVDGVDRLFTADNWPEYLAAEDAGLVGLKSSCARLLPDQLEWCRTIVPDRGPLIVQPNAGHVMSRAEELAARN